MKLDSDNREKENLKHMRAVLITHSYGTGPLHALDEFLSPVIGKCLFITHPFAYAKDLRSAAVLHENGKWVKMMRAPRVRFPQMVLYMKDALLTPYFMLRCGRRFDIYIGADPLNALVGLLMQKIGWVKIVVFYTIDYIPHRFENPPLNKLYRWMDKYCVYNCTKTWNLSPVMATEREKIGIRAEKNQITVPVGTETNVNRLPLEKINKHSIAFLGHLRAGSGIEFFIDALLEIVEQVPDVEMVLIGTGPLEDEIKKKAKAHGLEDHITFTGFVKTQEEIQKIIARCAIGIAPYTDDKKTFTRYTDPGKPKAYLASGLPVVITKVPQVAWEIEKERCGLAINYDKKELVDAVVKLLNDEELLKEYRENAIKFAGKYRWDKIFTDALESTLNYA